MPPAVFPHPGGDAGVLGVLGMGEGGDLTRRPPWADEEAERGNPSVKFKCLSPSAQLPTRGSGKAAGMDLHAAEACTIPRGGRGLVKTGLAVAVPELTYGRVAPRSGLAYKKGIDVGAGVIDEDYRGEVGVILFNFGEQAFEVKVGDRIAQLILERIVAPPIELVVGELPRTNRGSGGFGSTGVAGPPVGAPGTGGGAAAAAAEPPTGGDAP